jgi:hypothetical protein
MARVSFAGTFLGTLLIVLSLLSPADRGRAAVEGWVNHSWIQHVAGWSSSVRALGVIEGSDDYGNWFTHYSNAVGSWNSPFLDDPLHQEGDGEFALIHVVVGGSGDEAFLDFVESGNGNTPVFGTCDDARGGAIWWGAVIPYAGNGNPLGDSYAEYKVCIWPTIINDKVMLLDPQPDYYNTQGYHYRYLVIKHELGHILSLGDDADGISNCLMRSGIEMLDLCPGETNYVKDHYARN